MPNVQPLSREDLTEFEPLFRLAESSAGYVATSLYTLGRRPPILKAFVALGASVIGPGKVDTSLKQLVGMIASVSAGCRYCQAHTSTRAATLGVSPDKVAAVYDFETSQLFSPAERAALRLARDAAIVPNATTAEHFAELRQHYSESQIVEIVAVISLYGWTNRWNDTMATELENQPFSFASEHLTSQGWDASKHRGPA